MYWLQRAISIEYERISCCESIFAAEAVTCAINSCLRLFSPTSVHLGNSDRCTSRGTCIVPEAKQASGSNENACFSPSMWPPGSCRCS